MTDGKLDALRRDPSFSAMSPAGLLRLGRLVDLIDLPAGAVVSPADVPPRWAYYCLTGTLHVFLGGRPAPVSVAPVLFLPESLNGVALVAAASCRVVVVSATDLPAVLSLAPTLVSVASSLAASRSLRETR